MSSVLDIDRRDFMKVGGVTAIAAAVGGRTLVTDTTGQETDQNQDTDRELVKTICSHCAVGCGLKMEVENDTVVGQEAWRDHPINEGGLCAKGASQAQTVNSPRRLKDPMKKEDGEWVRIDWEEAMEEIAEELLRVREEYGPDSTMWMGSAKISNEEAYLFRKLAAFYGTNNVDHQARICHSTTVAGLANTWGFGAMTQSANDVQHADANLIIGHNPAEAHPVMMRYIQKARSNGGTVIVAEPRFTKTAAHANDFVRFRPGTDIPFIMGLLYVIVNELDAHDEAFLEERVYGWEDVKDRIDEYDPETVEDITWVPEDQLRDVARTLAESDVSTVEWSMGSTQHTVGTQNTRSYTILNLALGHTGTPGGGNNPVRGHDNVQGATDMCILSHTLPGYYGLDEGAWRHWSNVWDRSPWTSGSIDYDEMRDRFESQDLMEKNGLTVSRWFEAALDDTDRRGDLYQPEPVKALVVWGHSLNSLSEMKRVKQAMENVDLVVGVDPFPGLNATLADREDGIILLPAATRQEGEGSVTATNRSVQWRYQAVTPRHNTRTDFDMLTDLADRLGFGDHFDYDEIEEVLNEINLGTRSIGLIGQTPERIKQHMEESHIFRTEDLKAEVTDDHELAGEYFGLPWPCWHEDHPGTPILYRDDVHPAEGGHDFRARWGTEAPDGETLMRDAYEPDWWDDEIEGVPQYPGYATELPDEASQPAAKTIPIEYALSDDHSPYDAAQAIEGVDADEFADFDNEQPDPPTGRGRARAMTWNLPDEVPKHREPVETPRPELAEEYPNYDLMEDFYRLDLDNRGMQEDLIDLSDELQFILTTGRQVEHQGGGYTTRNTTGTANRAPMMYAEINPKVANERAIGTGDWVWVETDPGEMLVQARVTERVNQDEVFLPFHWAGLFEGEDYTDRYPEGTEPLVIGDSANIGTSVGYDVVTNMQATKATLCGLRVADDDEIPDLPEEQQAYQRQSGYTR